MSVPSSFYKSAVLVGPLASGVLALLLAGCAARPGAFEEPEAQSSEYLDLQTGATVTLVERPIVFARERSERAANLRDYVTLSAAAVNRAGKREYVLVAYVWSTLDARFSPVTTARELVLRADDRRIPLSASGKTPSDLGIARPVYAPRGQTVAPLVFPTDLDTLRFIAAAHGLAVQAGAEGEDSAYELWEDQRVALAKFVRLLEGRP
jgi:hypothetical protein